MQSIISYSRSPNSLHFDVRARYLHCTAFGPVHTLQYLQVEHHRACSCSCFDHRHQRENGDTPEAERVPNRKCKIRIERGQALGAACKVLRAIASSKAVLEIEFFNEVRVHGCFSCLS